MLRLFQLPFHPRSRVVKRVQGRPTGSIRWTLRTTVSRHCRALQVNERLVKPFVSSSLSNRSERLFDGCWISLPSFHNNNATRRMYVRERKKSRHRSADRLNRVGSYYRWLLPFRFLASGIRKFELPVALIGELWSLSVIHCELIRTLTNLGFRIAVGSYFFSKEIVALSNLDTVNSNHFCDIKEKY